MNWSGIDIRVHWSIHALANAYFWPNSGYPLETVSSTSADTTLRNAPELVGEESGHLYDEDL